MKQDERKIKENKNIYVNLKYEKLDEKLLMYAGLSQGETSK